MAVCVRDIVWSDPGLAKTRGWPDRYLVVKACAPDPASAIAWLETRFRLGIASCHADHEQVRAVSEVPWNELELGDRLISARGKNGTIIDLVDIQRYNGYDVENCHVHMTWEGVEDVSSFMHCWLDQVVYVGR